MAALDQTLVFTKTGKGGVEVTQRAAGLSMSARRILIMVDGKRTVGELGLLVKTGEIDGLIESLERQGLIQRLVPDTAARASRAADSDPGAAAELEVNTTGVGPTGERTLLTVDEVKRRAVRELNERLGPEAESMAIRFEHCRNVEQLRERLREAERLVAGFLGEAAAQDFMRALRKR